jgi:hypothetical protein
LPSHVQSGQCTYVPDRTSQCTYRLRRAAAS